MKPAGQAISRWKIVLWTYISAMLALSVTCAVILAWGWRPESPSNMPPFGASIQQCEAAFGHPLDANSNMESLHRWSQLFYRRGWSAIVSYDENCRAEQFIFCKTQIPTMQSPLMNKAEQYSLLEKFKGGSTWISPTEESFGLVWTRADGQAYASYIIDRRWMVLMTNVGMEKTVQAIR